MARVRMLQAQAGPLVVRHVGEEYDVEAAEAKRLVAAGFAEPVGGTAGRGSPGTRETASVAAPETAVQPKAARRRPKAARRRPKAARSTDS